ncbi:MAG: hypothetical protein EOO56_19800 [Hymenobacter sp.]|nr:MAG: hypothetical protein EOO56_19800 [Hymenobacter sp.]
MTLRLVFFLFLSFFLVGYRAQAQVYEAGWLVRTTGDTLRGELENGFWQEAPTFVRYRPAASGASQLFQARQLRAFGFGGGRHFRHEFLLLDQAAETRLQELPRGSHIDLRADSVLAEVLLTGPAELLRVVLPGAAHYEVRRPDQPPLRLSERKYLLENKSGGTWSMVDGNNYRNQLALYFADCPAASQAAGTAAFTAQGLSKVVQAYATACSPARQPARNWAAPAKRRWSAFQGGVLAGVRYNRLPSLSGDAEDCNDCGLHPFGGFYAELLQPSRTTAFYGELSFSNFRNRETHGTGFSPTGSLLYETLSYQAMLGTARIGVRFLPPLPHDQQLVLGLGFEYNKVLGLPSSARIYYDNINKAYAHPTLLPNLTLGWRRQRLTLLLDGQLYRRNDDGLEISNLFFTANYALRLGASFRLGRSPDRVAQR